MSDDNPRKQPRFLRLRRRRLEGAEKEEAREAVAQRPPPPPQPPPASTPHPPPEDEDAHTRIVVPRQARRVAEADSEPDVDIELREVRYGSTARMPYLRVVPKQRLFTRTAAGQIEATLLASRPRGPLGRYLADIKRVVIGSPFATSQAIQERLSKLKAMAILGSDPLSSSAYATQEMLVVLALAGAGALRYGLPIAGVVALLLAIVMLSYRQTIKAYPGGGGAYTVARENLGRNMGLLAASALMVDYVLLVSVSAAAGVAAITSAAPDLHDVRVPLSIAVVMLLTMGNLRGLRESGTLFAAPTYLFILAMGSMIVLGMAKVAAGDAPGSLLHGAPAREEVVAAQGLTLFLVLRAFSSGSAALTGVEAISNGVPTFKPPESANARTTLTVMACIAVFLFLGVTFLSSRYGIVPAEDETVISMLGRGIFGENVVYYLYQAATALILFLAANTSFNAFPLLGAILARDGFVPRQFAFKGDRLAYSNGILLLTAAAAILLIVFTAEVTKLIPLYALGVFVSFTLSQSGMVRHWWKGREAGWRWSLAVNGVGAATTGVVSLIIGGTKFAGGAWISILLIAALMAIFTLIFRHYTTYEEEVRLQRGEPPALPPQPPERAERERRHVVVPVARLDRLSAAAAQFARGLSARVTAVHVTDDQAQAEEFRDSWRQAVPDVPLLILESPYRAFVAPMLTYFETLRRAEPDSEIVVVLPSLALRHWWERLLHNQDILRLKSELKKVSGLRVEDFRYEREGAAV
jgi:amino acid transporter